MCLIALAVRAARFPLVIAANRDEDYERPTLAAHFWTDSPDILGGRDALHGGTWLAVTLDGRFGAVTNLRGSAREPQKRSRGELVAGFVGGSADPLAYLSEVAARAHEYAGFHLIAGNLETVVQFSGSVTPLGEGVHALSNAPAGERWPKVGIAEVEMQKLVETGSAEEVLGTTLRFLSAKRGTNRVESEVFVAGERYGTRSSTAIIVTPERELLFAEQSYARGGVPDGEPRRFRFALH